MARKPRLWCADCGAPMHKCNVSLPQGQARCRPCRQASPTWKPVWRPREPELRFCEWCARPYETTRSRQRFCSTECCDKRRRKAGSGPSSRASTTARGYGTEHQRERRHWQALVDEGDVDCCLCGYLIAPGEPWHLDHTPDRTDYRGAAHAVCNIRDGGRRARQRGGSDASKETQRRAA